MTAWLSAAFSLRKEKEEGQRELIMLRAVREAGRAAEPQTPGIIILLGAQLAVFSLFLCFQLLTDHWYLVFELYLLKYFE